MKKLRGNRSGFTLIELIVVMIIIGILVLLATPRFLNYIKDANVTALQVDAKVLGDAALFHSIRGGQGDDYPVTGGYETISNLEVHEDFKAVVEGNLIDAGLSEEAAKKELERMKFGKLDKEAIKDQVRNTKNNIEDYYIVEDGTLEGFVFYNQVLENSMGESFAGLIGVDISEE